MYLMDSSHVFHVAKAGNDGNGGLAQQYPVGLAADAKLTIQAAVNAAADGDTIIIWPGDYDETVTLTGKALTLTGTSRTRSRIKAATGDGVVVDDDCTFINLAIEALGTGAHAVNISDQTNVVIDGCDIYGSFDGIIATGAGRIMIRNSLVRGQYDAINIDSANGLILDGCIFYADGTYGVTIRSRAAIIHGDGVVVNNCAFIAKRTDTTAMDCGAVTCGASTASFTNCSFEVDGGANQSGPAYGILYIGGGRITLTGCSFHSVSASATWGVPYNYSAGPKDIAAHSGDVFVSNCAYETTAKTDGMSIVLMNTGWAAAISRSIYK